MLIVVLYGLAIGVGQFGLLFIAVRAGFPVGLASLVIQLQAFFTILFAWALLGEQPRMVEIVGALISFAGIALIGAERLGGASFGPLLLVIAAAAFWGAGNVIGKLAGRIDMLAFTAWSSLAAPLPLFARCPRGSTGGRRSPPLLHPAWTLGGSASPAWPMAARSSASACGRACCRAIRRRRWRLSRCSFRSSG